MVTKQPINRRLYFREGWIKVHQPPRLWQTRLKRRRKEQKIRDDEPSRKRRRKEPSRKETTEIESSPTWKQKISKKRAPDLRKRFRGRILQLQGRRRKLQERRYGRRRKELQGRRYAETKNTPVSGLSTILVQFPPLRVFSPLLWWVLGAEGAEKIFRVYFWS